MKEQIKSFEDLRKLKKTNKKLIVGAPHPFYFMSFCLGSELIKHRLNFIGEFNLYLNRSYEKIMNDHIRPNRDNEITNV